MNRIRGSKGLKAAERALKPGSKKIKKKMAGFVSFALFAKLCLAKKLYHRTLVQHRLYRI